MNRILTRSVLIFAGVIFAFVFNFSYLEGLIIPDPCYYHFPNRTPSKTFSLFYEITAGEGFHPSASNLNLIVTLGSGVLIGWLMSKIRFNKKNKKGKIM